MKLRLQHIHFAVLASEVNNRLTNHRMHGNEEGSLSPTSFNNTDHPASHHLCSIERRGCKRRSVDRASGKLEREHLDIR